MAAAGSSVAVRCPRCGCDNLDFQTVCRDCGARLAPSKQWPKAPSGLPDPVSPREFLESHNASPAQARSSVRPSAPDFQFSPHTVSTRRCGRCNTTNPANASYCSSCGASMASSSPALASVNDDAVIECPRCHTNNPADHSFCQSCGVALSSDHPPAYVSSEPRQASLVVIGQDGSAGRRYPLTSPQTDIGREEGDIRLANDPYVCPRHARITRRNGQFCLSDLGSVNRVYLGLTRPKLLEDGDLVLIGLEVLRFHAVNEAERALAPAVERGTRVFGSPATQRYARLDQRSGEGIARNVYYLTRDETVIGREAGDIVFTDDPFMSRQHAALTRDKSGHFTLRDLGSSNGTYLAIRGEVQINTFDHIRIGQHLFRVEITPGERD